MEEWRAIEGFPYSVSSLGRVRRDTGCRGTRAGKILKNCPDANGYAVVNLRRDNTNGTKKYVHHLVAAAFLPPKPSDLHHIAHWDGDGMNANPGNLRWVTQSENEADKKRHGRARYAPKGSKTFNATQIDAIRTLVANGASINSVRHKYGVSWSTVTKALESGAAI